MNAFRCSTSSDLRGAPRNAMSPAAPWGDVDQVYATTPAERFPFALGPPPTSGYDGPFVAAIGGRPRAFCGFELGRSQKGEVSTVTIRRFRGRTLEWALVAIAALALAVPLTGEDSITAGTQKGEWGYWGGDEGSSRYSPLDQINAENFGDLEIAWRWKADNYGPSVDYIYRSTPIYVNGKLYTVAGQRRTVLCIDPATGETLWMWRMKENPRWEASVRKNYGKGVAHAVVDGRDFVYVVTPGYYLVALDADTGLPIPYFGMNGIVDLHLGLGDYAVDPDRGISEYGDIPRTGKTRAHPTILTTKSLLIYGEGRAGGALLHAVSKKTGEEIAQVEIPAPTNTAPMTYMHEGRQYIVLSVAGRGHAAEHVVLTLPEE